MPPACRSRNRNGDNCNNSTSTERLRQQRAEKGFTLTHGRSVPSLENGNMASTAPLVAESQTPAQLSEAQKIAAIEASTTRTIEQSMTEGDSVRQIQTGEFFVICRCSVSFCVVYICVSQVNFNINV